MKRVFTLIILGIFLGYTSCNSGSGNRKSSVGYLTVTRVVDGDTFWAADGTEKGLNIRLIGVDTPESRNTGRKVVGYFGAEAKVFTSQLLSGKKVRLEYDVDSFDQYGRTLAYVYLEDGTFVNAELMKQGYAMVMTYPPNVKYAELFLKLQQEARENNRGLWANK